MLRTVIVHTLLPIAAVILQQPDCARRPSGGALEIANQCIAVVEELVLPQHVDRMLCRRRLSSTVRFLPRLFLLLLFSFLLRAKSLLDLLLVHLNLVLILQLLQLLLLLLIGVWCAARAGSVARTTMRHAARLRAGLGKDVCRRRRTAPIAFLRICEPNSGNQRNQRRDRKAVRGAATCGCTATGQQLMS